MSLFIHFIEYFRFLRNILRYNVKPSILFLQLLDDFYLIGVKSLLLMSIMSFAIGVVISHQLITMLSSVYAIPDILIVSGIKNTILLEFTPTILCFVFIGRNVTALTCSIFDNKRIGYYDNFKVIGVNIESFACLSKVITCTLCFPLLTVFSCCFSLLGAYLFTVNVNGMNQTNFLNALITFLNTGFLNFCMFKAFIFGFLSGSIGTYLGFCCYNCNNKNIITVSQHCFTVLSSVLLIGDFVLNLFKYAFLIEIKLI